MCVFLRKKGERTPPELRPYLKSDSSSCLKKGMVEIFTLGDPDGTTAVIISKYQGIAPLHVYFIHKLCLRLICMYNASSADISFLTPQWCTIQRKKLLVAVMPASTLAIASAVNAGT